MSSIKLREMASPKPVPPNFRVVVPSTITKGEKFVLLSWINTYPSILDCHNYLRVPPLARRSAADSIRVTILI
jgi:hypothetical protein